MTDSEGNAHNAAPANPMRVITMSREYGSGGGEIASRLALKLGWRLVDHEVVVEVAHRLGVAESDAAQRDEQPESLVDQVLRSFRAVDPTPLSLVGIPDVLVSPQMHDYMIALRDTVLATAKAGDVVIVGRGAQAILGQRRDVLHVRIVAPLAQRVTYVSRREDLNPELAERRIHKKDSDRRRSLITTHDRRPDDATLYDIVLNTAVLDLDSCVDLILLALERKGRLSRLPTDALGPGAGLAAYPSVPSDLPVIAPDATPTPPIPPDVTPAAGAPATTDITDTPAQPAP